MLSTDLFEFARNPYVWWEQAHTLYQASEHLFHQFLKTHQETLDRDAELSEGEERDVAYEEIIGRRLFYPAFMLMGLAIEVAFKGVLIRNDPNIIEEGILGKKLNTHCLVDLAKYCELNFNDEQIAMLKLLEEFIVWSGRYPLPKKTGGLKTFERRLMFPEDFFLAKSIFTEINKTLSTRSLVPKS